MFLNFIGRLIGNRNQKAINNSVQNVAQIFISKEKLVEHYDEVGEFEDGYEPVKKIHSGVTLITMVS